MYSRSSSIRDCLHCVPKRQLRRCPHRSATGSARCFTGCCIHCPEKHFKEYREKCGPGSPAERSARRYPRSSTIRSPTCSTRCPPNRPLWPFCGRSPGSPIRSTANPRNSQNFQSLSGQLHTASQADAVHRRDADRRQTIMKPNRPIHFKRGKTIRKTERCY